MTETQPTFADRWLKPSLLVSLEKKGYAIPTPIQEQTRTAFKTGHHIVGQSQTGSGKTAAYLLPLLQQVDPSIAKPQVVILAPTRELALQIEEECFELTRGLFGVKGVLVCGGMSFRNQVDRIQRGANIIIGTPGRIMEMLRQKIIQTRDVGYFVLDEVDRMLDMWFAEEVEDIRARLPEKMQILCFSATILPELQYMLDKHLPEGYENIKIHKEMLVTELDHAFIRVPESEKVSSLVEYLKLRSHDKVVVFAQTKLGVRTLEKTLSIPGYQTLALHGDIDQYERIKTMKAFKQAKGIILVATDVASRGLNLHDVDLVVNYDMPQDPQDYVHRVGRTARAGKSGEAVMFVTPSEMMKLHRLERTNKMQIKEIDISGTEITRKPAPSYQSEKRGSYQKRPYRGWSSRSSSGWYSKSWSSYRGSSGSQGGSGRGNYGSKPSSWSHRSSYSR